MKIWAPASKSSNPAILLVIDGLIDGLNLSLALQYWCL